MGRGVFLHFSMIRVFTMYSGDELYTSVEWWGAWQYFDNTPSHVQGEGDSSQRLQVESIAFRFNQIRISCLEGCDPLPASHPQGVGSTAHCQCYCPHSGVLSPQGQWLLPSGAPPERPEGGEKYKDPLVPTTMRTPSLSFLC